MRRRHRAVHRRVWLALAVLLPVGLLLAVGLRQGGPHEAAAVRMSAPR